MQRQVDQRDYRALTDARRVIGEVFDSPGTDWFPDEQASLHEALAGIGRVVDSLRGETAIRAIARRIVARSLKDLWRKRGPSRTCGASGEKAGTKTGGDWTISGKEPWRRRRRPAG